MVILSLVAKPLLVFVVTIVVVHPIVTVIFRCLESKVISPEIGLATFLVELLPVDADHHRALRLGIRILARIVSSELVTEVNPNLKAKMFICCLVARDTLLLVAGVTVRPLQNSGVQ